MKKMLAICTKALDLARPYLTSLYRGFKQKKLFDDVKTYCMFIGYARSGKSLIASLLDAHPNIIIADELDALNYIYARFSRRQIYYLLLENSRTFAKTGRMSKGYLYEVPNQWQGRFNRLHVIGDNQGEAVTHQLRARPWLLQRLYKTVGIKVKFIHVIRNPYDNTSAISLERKRLNLNLRDSVEYYFSLCKAVVDIQKQIKSSDIFELRHELFIANPKTNLKELCCFLGVETSDDYLNDCASIVFKSPHKSRYDTQWSPELIDTVKSRIDEFPFLQGYSYED